MRKNTGKFTQRNSAAGGPNSLKQEVKYESTTSPKGIDMANAAEREKKRKESYVGKKKTPDGKMYTNESYAFAKKGGHLKD